MAFGVWFPWRSDLRSRLEGELLPDELEYDEEGADINEDGIVDFQDFAILMDNWLKSY